MVSSPCSAPRHHNPDAELTAQELRELGEQGPWMQTTDELIRLLQGPLDPPELRRLGT